MKSLPKAHGRSSPLSNFPPKHQLKGRVFSLDRVFKAHETHPINLDMSATHQECAVPRGTRAQADGAAVGELVPLQHESWALLVLVLLFSIVI